MCFHFLFHLTCVSTLVGKICTHLMHFRVIQQLFLSILINTFNLLISGSFRKPLFTVNDPNDTEVANTSSQSLSSLANSRSASTAFCCSPLQSSISCCLIFSALLMRVSCVYTLLYEASNLLLTIRGCLSATDQKQWSRTAGPSLQQLNGLAGAVGGPARYPAETRTCRLRRACSHEASQSMKHLSRSITVMWRSPHHGNTSADLHTEIQEEQYSCDDFRHCNWYKPRAW